MTGISITFDFEDTEARTMLRALIGRMDNLRPFLDRAGDRMLNSTSQSFRNERAPDGTPWTPLQAATIRARTRKGQLPLTILRTNTRTGSSLAGSINKRITNEEARVGTPVPYGAIHQLGGTINRPSRQGWIYRLRGADGQIGRRFAKREDADVKTEVAIPAHSITIPARPYLGLSQADAQALMEDAEDWLRQ